jgi:RND family efflux transporter MFP subunit
MPRLPVVLVCAVLFAGVVQAAAPPGLLEVEAARPTFRLVMKQNGYNARIEPRETIQVRARVSGPVMRVLHREGGKVKKGDVLFEVDARFARIALAKAEAELKRATVRVKRAKGDALAKEEAEADLAVAQASVEEARLKVELAQIRSPLDGRIRKACVEVGSVVRADGTVLAVVDSVGPVHAVFEVPEYDYVRNFRLIRSGKAPAGKEAANVVVHIDGADCRAGKIVVVGTYLFAPKEPGTHFRVATVRAEVPDPDETLSPGMDVRVMANMSAPTKMAYTAGYSVTGRIESRTTGTVEIVNAKGAIEYRRVTSDDRYPNLESPRHGTLDTVVGLTEKDWVVVKKLVARQPDRPLPPLPLPISEGPPRSKDEGARVIARPVKVIPKK